MQPVSTRERFAALQVERMHHAARVHETHAVAFQALHDEPFSAEQTDP
jgi:hypothetical protein